MKSSLLIGFRDDPHLIAVAEAVERRGRHSYILDPHEGNACITCGFLPGHLPRLSISSERISTEQIASVWFRFKPVIPLPSWEPMQASAARFVQGEWRTTLRGLEQSLPYALWVNSPQAQLQANSKIEQLRRAKACGFKVPETLITNNPSDIIDFICTQHRVVYKTIEWITFPDLTGVYTTEITEQMIRDNAASIIAAPGIFQQFVEKQFELRVTVVGDKIFSARINTPRGGKGAIDWRHNILDQIYEPWQLDDCTEIAVRAYQRELGLLYGAFDFICTPSGEVIFLECNPAGQYLWIEKAASLPITAAIADFLCAATGNDGLHG